MLASCLWLLIYGLYPPRLLSGELLKGELGFQCLLPSNGVSHMPKPGVEVASKSRSLADMTLGTQLGTKMTELEHQEKNPPGLVLQSTARLLSLL